MSCGILSANATDCCSPAGRTWTLRCTARLSAPNAASCALPATAWRAALLDAALRLNKPVLGICRGLQFLNVHTGGTLYQDLDAERPGCAHRMERPYDRPAHTVDH